MCGSMVDIQSPTAEIRRGKKKKKIEITGQKYTHGLPYYIGRPQIAIMSWKRRDLTYEWCFPQYEGRSKSLYTDTVSHKMCASYLVTFWATVCKTVRPILSDLCLSVCLSCLWRWCTVAKRLDGSRWNLALGKYFIATKLLRYRHLQLKLKLKKHNSNWNRNWKEITET